MRLKILLSIGALIASMCFLLHSCSSVPPEDTKARHEAVEVLRKSGHLTGAQVDALHLAITRDGAGITWEQIISGLLTLVSLLASNTAVVSALRGPRKPVTAEVAHQISSLTPESFGALMASHGQ